MARRRPGLWGKLLRALVLVVAILIAIPAVLTPVYLVVDPVSMPMLARSLTGKPVIREWRDIDDISDRLKASLVMSEDGQFCRHWGVDLGALRDEINTYLAGGDARGASTITMQVARNLFLWNDRSVVRKALEVPLAIYIDLIMPKRRIMEIYLNIAEWGPNGEFGIEAGAKAAFGIDADALTWRQATLLAVSITNPHVRKAATPSERFSNIARIVEARARVAAQRIECLYENGVPALD